MAIGLPLWKVVFDEGTEREKARIMSANCYEAALNGAVKGLRHHYGIGNDGFNTWKVEPYYGPQ